MSAKGPRRIDYDLSSGNYGGSPYYYLPRRGIKFSRLEWRHIGVAFAVLVAAFMIILTVHVGLMADLPLAILISVVSVLTGFLLHELMHKYYAQRFGAWAEFRYSLFGLIFGLFTSLLGLLLAAPGAVYISGNLDRRENGIVSAAGPLTNTAFSFVFLGGALAVSGYSVLWTTFFAGVAFLDAWLGAFNMIPVPPLDGSKILMWNLRAYAICLLLPIISLAVLYLSGLIVLF